MSFVSLVSCSLYLSRDLTVRVLDDPHDTDLEGRNAANQHYGQVYSYEGQPTSQV